MKLRNLTAGLLALCSFFPSPAYAKPADNQTDNKSEVEISSLVEKAPTSYSLSNKIGSENYSIDFNYDSDKVRMKIYRRSEGTSYSLYLADYPDKNKQKQKYGTIDLIEFLFTDKRKNQQIEKDNASRNIKITIEYDSRSREFSPELKKDSEEIYRTILEYVSSSRKTLNQGEIKKIDDFYRKYFQRGDEKLFDRFYESKGRSLKGLSESARKASISSGRLSRRVNTPSKSEFLDLFSLIQFLP